MREGEGGWKFIRMREGKGTRIMRGEGFCVEDEWAAHEGG